MQKYSLAETAGKSARTALFWLQALVIAFAAILPLVASNSASALQMTNRKVIIDKSYVGAANNNVTFAFTYTPPTTTQAQQGIVYTFCTTPLGTCTLPVGMVVNAATHTSQTGFPTNATAFAVRGGVDLGGCTSTSTATIIRCFNRTQAGNGTGTAVTHTIAGITAPTAKQTVYVRVSLYADAAFATLTDSGTVAAAFVDQITTTGRVQERLNFCAASQDGASGAPASVAACVALASTAIDIGTIDNSTIARSPVVAAGGNGANNKYGILMLDSNSVNNSVITYYPEIDTTGGASNQLRNFRVPGAACNVAPSNTTDQCFVDAGVTGVATFVAGTEDFGLQVACVEDMGTSTTGLSTVPVAYSNTDASVASSATCQTTDAGVKFYWDVTGTPSQIATGTGYVDNEAVKIRYGATAAATTPGGSYSVTTTFVATPAF